MHGNFSEEALEAYQEALLSLVDQSLEQEDSDFYDFTRCLRPNGTAYGTRGACQPPNKVASQQDVSSMNQKDFQAGGGVSAVRKGLSSVQVVNRGRDARARAFAAGGGTTAMGKRGLSRDEVVRQGAVNRAKAVQAGGGLRDHYGDAERAARQGAVNRANAFKAGGGQAAVRRGENVEGVIKRGAANLKAAYEAGGGRNTPFSKADVISQGRRNLEAAYKAGGGDAARASGLSVKDIIDKGRKSLKAAYKAGGGDAATARLGDEKKVIARGIQARQEAARAGGGDIAKGKKNLANISSNRSALEAGGGQAAIKKQTDALTQKLGRKLTADEIKGIQQNVSNRGQGNLYKYFQAGGGRKAMGGGKSVDEVISAGERIIKDRQRKAKEAKAQELQGRIAKQSQVT